MTKLKCSVQSCMYNEDSLCCKGDIKVEGKDAKATRETSCSSFKERSHDCGCNTVGHKSKTIDVDCDAVKCVYNENLKCQAKQIGIAGSGHAKESKETECATFTCK